MNMLMCMDEETQIKGCTVIGYSVGHEHGLLDSIDKELYSGLVAVKEATPLRVVAQHYCCSDSAFTAILSFVTRITEQHVKIRTMMHKGEFFMIS